MKRLYRSSRDKKIFGLCGGLAEIMNVDATILRVILVITTFFTGGVVIGLYILASLFIPKEPDFGGPYSGAGGYGAGHGGYGGGHFHHNHTGYTGGGSAYANPAAGGRPYNEPPKSDLDEMMKDIEKKAMQKEIEELRAKLAKYEKGE